MAITEGSGRDESSPLVNTTLPRAINTARQHSTAEEHENMVEGHACEVGERLAQRCGAPRARSRSPLAVACDRSHFGAMATLEMSLICQNHGQWQNCSQSRMNTPRFGANHPDEHNTSESKMADAEDSGAPRALTAAEKRAARRARVLQGSESRLKLVTGQIASLKAEGPGAEAALERQLDAGVDELLSTEDAGADVRDGAAAAADETKELKLPARVDPAQRRRDAALRRKRKEAAVQELLSGGRGDSVGESVGDGEAAAEDSEEGPAQEVAATVKPKAKAPATFSRHSLALQLQLAQDKVVALAIMAAAVYIGARSGSLSVGKAAG